MVRKEMNDLKVNKYILGSLDDIAWLFNIRGNDIPKNPVVMSYAMISLEKAFLFLRKDQLDFETQENLKINNVEVFDYEEISKIVNSLDQNSVVYIDSNKINHFIYTKIPKECVIIEGINLTTKLKAIKNEIELKNLINCQTRDGVATVKFIYWLKNNIGKEEITEMSADEKLEFFRNEQEYFVSPSFDTIAGYGDHAAMMHYKATIDNQYVLKEKGMFLIDSGGQYFDGTTDITRTIVLGDLTDEEKRDFTLVLKAHIGLCSAKFLYGATGSNLDILARYPLWKEGIDYKCGTGHGVGYFLNVHEGPHGFSQVPNTVKLEKNMIITVEPGIYRENKHGIRIENTVVVVEDSETEFGQFLKFNTISYCPIDLDAICIEMLDENEKKWLNNYHKEVYERLSPFLDENIKLWLKNNTKEI
jgi:Xaa-Pro aminopeptidase